MALVAQAQALPEKMVAPFTIGAPKDADASQVLIAAQIDMKDGCLLIDGQTFSFNKQINQTLQEANKVYRPIQGKYVGNKGMQALLAGINAAVDMDNIIRSVNGDMSIIIPSYSDDNLQLSMAAQLGNKNWLGDVDYWKQSCPKGGKIVDWEKDSYYYTDGKTSFYFGVSADNQFFSGDSQQSALSSIKSAAKQLPENVKKQIIGKRMAMLFNLSGLTSDKSEATAVTGLLKPFFGDINAIVYSIK